ncbi:glycosyl transferase [Planomonospora parontospora subsp. parontospora]|uniref:Glycosyl transferase n=2 Tax=Planomonospora parontospora TaxID=58119 RepID=A0AA37F5Q5_9ACTN|nr:glycosyltransferase family 39 protein [Planomonospora parontospora]GGK78476.1 glycosyl transferase [Planomonospora parontospora]GII10320.1 glycosyl transferase [Planomonospora parontospora subsp. parontospora]
MNGPVPATPAGPGAVPGVPAAPDAVSGGASTAPDAAPRVPDVPRAARHGGPEAGTPRWARPGLWAVLALAAFLHTWALGRNGDANDYYAAAILSGTQSWKAFFFGALDAGSFITVDKPPVALWVMGLSARIFGYGTWSMLLPQAVAGVAAVWVVHSAVRRSLAELPGHASQAAGLAAALVMTLTPITVAINRDNNPDTILVLLLVLAAWFCLEAVRGGRTRPLVVSAVLIGLAFNTKMLQAYLVVPAFALVYLALAPGTVVRRFGRLLAAGAALAASSGWWMLVVDLWPAGSRPYVGGSTDNSVRDLVIGYNGLGRIFGGSGRGSGGGGGFGGEPGAGRLFNEVLAGQISWLLPFAVLALACGLVLATRRSLTGARAALLLWGGWLVVHYAVFSFSSGTFHPYYTTAMAPAVAALTGIGGVLMWQAHRDSPAWAWALPLGVAVTGAWSFTVLRRSPDFVPWLAWAVAGMSAVAALGLVAARLGRRSRLRIAAVALLVGVIGGLAGPAAYALTPLGAAVNGTNPTAGPAGGGGPGGLRGFDGMPGGAVRGGMRDGGPDRFLSAEMIAYLKENRGGATWLVAVGGAQSASSAILSTGLPVIAMGGFTGGDPAMTVDRLRELVASGRLGYVMPGDGRRGPGGGGSSEVSTWVRAECTAVAPSEYGGAGAAEGTTGTGPSLYRCG